MGQSQVWLHMVANNILSLLPTKDIHFLVFQQSKQMLGSSLMLNKWMVIIISPVFSECPLFLSFSLNLPTAIPTYFLPPPTPPPPLLILHIVPFPVTFFSHFFLLLCYFLPFHPGDISSSHINSSAWGSFLLHTLEAKFILPFTITENHPFFLFHAQLTIKD